MSKLNTIVNGKGSKPRITDKGKFDSNFDQIDWNKKSELKYIKQSNDKNISNRQHY